MSFDLVELEHAVARHGVVGRIVVASHAGSTPRETGTSMLVWKDGQSGTIGGGALEFEAVRTLRARLVVGKSFVEKLPLGPALGQCCGGAVTLVSEVFDAANLPEQEDHFIRRCDSYAEQPLPVRRIARHARNGQENQNFFFENGWLAESIQARKTPLWIYGAGHVGRAIVSTVSPLPDFATTWVDTAPDRFPADTPDDIRILPAPSPATAVSLAPPDAQHLILTYSHTLDLELCHQVLSRSFGGAGLIGSATKWARFKTRLTALGHTPEQIDRISCPIGEPRLGKHPQAIALGVASRLVLDSHERSISGVKGEQATA